MISMADGDSLSWHQTKLHNGTFEVGSNCMSCCSPSSSCHPRRPSPFWHSALHRRGCACFSTRSSLNKLALYLFTPLHQQYSSLDMSFARKSWCAWANSDSLV
jgi:hypothetical protein